MLQILAFLSTPALASKKTKPVKKAKNAKIEAVNTQRKEEVKKTKRIAGNDSKKEVLGLKLNAYMGVCFMEGSLLGVGGQLGKPANEKGAFFWGLEVSFALSAPSSILMLLSGGWYEIALNGSPKYGVVLGAFGGVAVSQGISALPRHSLALFGDLAVYQALDSSVSIRGQLRPGLVDRNFAFMMNFSVSFCL